MTKLRLKVRSSQLFEWLRQKDLDDHITTCLRVSRRSEGEGPEALTLRRLAERSLMVPSRRHAQ